MRNSNHYLFVQICAVQCGCGSLLCGAHSLNVQFSRVHFMQETLNRLIPPDGNGYWYSGYLAGGGGRKDRYLEVFEYIVDREEVDKEDESENNGVCIFRVACLGVEEESDSLCLSLKENFQWRKQMSTSYLMIPDSCDQRGGGSACLCVCVCSCAFPLRVCALHVLFCFVFVAMMGRGSFLSQRPPLLPRV